MHPDDEVPEAPAAPAQGINKTTDTSAVSEVVRVEEPTVAEATGTKADPESAED